MLDFGFQGVNGGSHGGCWGGKVVVVKYEGLVNEKGLFGNEVSGQGGEFLWRM